MIPALPEPDRTLCMVRGNIAPGAMCGSMIVGDKSCGNRTSPCQHKVPQFTAAQLEQYARDYHATQMGEPFGHFRAEPFGWTDCAETDEGAIALYELKGDV